MTSGFHVVATRGHKQFEFGTKVWYKASPKSDEAVPGHVIGIEMTEEGHGSIHVQLGPYHHAWVANADHLELRWDTASAPKIGELR